MGNMSPRGGVRDIGRTRSGTHAPPVSPEDVRAAGAVSAALGRRRLVVVLAVFLYLFGLVMVTSATSGTELLNTGSQWGYFRKQAVFGLLGLTAMFVAMRFPLGLLRRLAFPLLVISAGLSLAVFLPGLGATAKGATRWLALGPIQMQPSELVKIAVIVYVADHLARTRPPRHWLNDFVKSPGGISLGAAALVFMQRDLGTALVIGTVAMSLYVLAGTNWRLLARVIGPGIGLVILGILGEEYRRERFLAFLNPWADPTGNGYQLVQALIAIGSGGVFGVGLGHSVQKIRFLPEAHTDMIFSVVVEELGLVGVAVVLFGFVALAVVGTRIALKASNRFNALIAAGLTSMLCLQAVINLGGVVGVLPLTGVPLPLISYGGTNLLVTLASLGLLANIATAGHADRAEAHSHPQSILDDDLEVEDELHARRGRRWWHGGSSRASVGSR
jgi:cell division protein FtsW